MSKQVEFKDFAEDIICTGILLDDGNVVCACCGGMMEADERGETWEIVKEYENWVNFHPDLKVLLQTEEILRKYGY